MQKPRFKTVSPPSSVTVWVIFRCRPSPMFEASGINSSTLLVLTVGSLPEVEKPTTLSAVFAWSAYGTLINWLVLTIV